MNNVDYNTLHQFFSHANMNIFLCYVPLAKKIKFSIKAIFWPRNTAGKNSLKPTEIQFQRQQLTKTFFANSQNFYLFIFKYNLLFKFSRNYKITHSTKYFRRKQVIGNFLK